ncbi:hypothetical protein EX895_001495 [Sporisorium graminicola]|uniref:Anaphase control protein cut9 n=1 Tax=Sporisorium graminicola TaxID=280036 RepID=A0A4U7KYS0_9BASI|nr:hypothetical protein EX895_001495 [Sporisorium graminicola]TKY89710.1 hypothetical protein EX895_001495 [Sporisorium graminicola]
MVPAGTPSSPGFPFHSPKPRQITKLAFAGPSGSRSAPPSPHTPVTANNNLAQPYASGTFNPDGSLSVVRNDDDANNSGLLDLSPALSRVVKSARPNFASSPTSSKRQRIHSRTSFPHHHQKLDSIADEDLSGLGAQLALPKRRSAAKSRLSSHANFGNVVQSSQPAEDHLHSDPLGYNGVAASSDVEAEKDAAAPSSSSQPAYAEPAGLALDSGDDADDISLDHDEADSTLTRLRRWRQDAMQQHLYDTAIFWGSKVLALETTAAAFNDAYHLAQCYFYTHQYARAEQLLTSPLRTGTSRSRGATAVTTASAGNGETAHYSAKQTGAEGFLPSDNVQEDEDALQEVLQRTRSASILPASIMARSTTKDSMYSATSSTTGKRKKRDFNVTATGTGSSQTESSGRDAESDEEFLKDASIDNDNEQEGSVVFKEAPARRHGTKQSTQTGVDLQADVDQVKNSSVAPAHGPILVNHSLACRYLAAQCQVRLAKYHEALDLLGETEHWGTSASNKRPSNDGGIKLGSSVAYLRGQIHLRLEDLPRARDAFMAALALDVKNYEAFSALIGGEMLGVQEQWAFVQGLEYAAQAGAGEEAEEGAEADFEMVRLLYTTQLSKRGERLVETTAVARRRLVEEYGLGEDADVLCGLADELFSRLRFADAFVVTSRVLELCADHAAALPIHIACTYHLRNLRPALFMLAHRLTELQPEAAVSWYAVGTWYATTRRWAEARRYYSKASLLDPRFAPGWIAFGHTFAMEGESDQAIIAYSTAARLFPQSHLPKLFVGMEHLHQDNLSLARLSLEGAASIWAHDPLLANERGVVALQTGDLEGAAELFGSAIEMAKETQHPAASWTACYLNLGLALMRMGARDVEARRALESVVELDPHSYQAHLGLAMLAHKQGELDDAIQHYHEALSINPRDAYATELLDFVLEEKVHYGVNKFSKYDPLGRLGKHSQSEQQQGEAKGKGKHRQLDTFAQRPGEDLETILESPVVSATPPSRHGSAHDGATAREDTSTATAAEMSLDVSADAFRSQHSLDSDLPTERYDQSSVLMDESTS